MFFVQSNALLFVFKHNQIPVFVIFQIYSVKVFQLKVIEVIFFYF